MSRPDAELPAPTPAPSVSADEAQNQKQHHGTDERIYDQSDYTGAEVNAEPRQQPVADECAD